MRYRVALLLLLMLLIVLPMMQLLAAPAPDPFGILDIGPPPSEKTAQQHLKFQIEFKTDYHILDTVSSYPEVRRLPSVASMKDARRWLAKNLQVTAVDGDRRLRLSFRAGTIAERIIIINAFLRASLDWHDIGGETLKCAEEFIRSHERSIETREILINRSKDPQEIARYQETIHWLRYTEIPELRAAIAELKQYAVIRWAR